MKTKEAVASGEALPLGHEFVQGRLPQSQGCHQWLTNGYCGRPRSAHEPRPLGHRFNPANTDGAYCKEVNPPGVDGMYCGKDEAAHEAGTTPAPDAGSGEENSEDGRETDRSSRGSIPDIPRGQSGRVAKEATSTAVVANRDEVPEQPSAINCVNEPRDCGDVRGQGDSPRVIGAESGGSAAAPPAPTLQELMRRLSEIPGHGIEPGWVRCQLVALIDYLAARERASAATTSHLVVMAEQVAALEMRATHAERINRNQEADLANNAKWRVGLVNKVAALEAKVARLEKVAPWMGIDWGKDGPPKAEPPCSTCGGTGRREELDVNGYHSEPCPDCSPSTESPSLKNSPRRGVSVRRNTDFHAPAAPVRSGYAQDDESRDLGNVAKPPEADRLAAALSAAPRGVVTTESPNNPPAANPTISQEGEGESAKDVRASTEGKRLGSGGVQNMQPRKPHAGSHESQSGQGEPYRLEQDDSETCGECCHGRMWWVVGPDDVALSMSWADPDDGAEWVMRNMNDAYRLGADQGRDPLDGERDHVAAKAETERPNNPPPEPTQERSCETCRHSYLGAGKLYCTAVGGAQRSCLMRDDGEPCEGGKLWKPRETEQPSTMDLMVEGLAKINVAKQPSAAEDGDGRRDKTEMDRVRDDSSRDAGPAAGVTKPEPMAWRHKKGPGDPQHYFTLKRPYGYASSREPLYTEAQLDQHARDAVEAERLRLRNEVGALPGYEDYVPEGGVMALLAAKKEEGIDE